MKKKNYIPFLGLLFFVFGFTDLNFENLNFDVNKKAYVFIGIGILFLVISRLQNRNKDIQQ